MEQLLSNKIDLVLNGKIKTETSATFYEQYHKNFRESGEHKAKRVLNQLSSLTETPDLSKMAYINIGGSEGSEIEYILRNSPVNYGVLIELDTYACQMAAEKAANLPPSKALEVISGDVTQQLESVQKILQTWRAEGTIDGILVAANAVLHELPERSPGFNFNTFFGEMFWDWDSCIFMCREPCEPFNWPDRVEFCVEGVDSSQLFKLAKTIKARLEFSGEVRRSGPCYISAPRNLATETIHKLFYLDDFEHEIQERITTIKPEKFVSMLERHLGKNSVFEVRLNSSSFSRKYQQYKVNARTEEGVELPMPLSFFSVVASKVN